MERQKLIHSTPVLQCLVWGDLQTSAWLQFLQTLVLVSLEREQNKENRVKSFSSVLQVKQTWKPGGLGWFATSCCCFPETQSKVCVPGCHPASSEFLRSSAYGVESSGVVSLCQYRETLSRMEFLIPWGTGYTNVKSLYNVMILSMVGFFLFR